MFHNKCPYDLDIEFWQLICNEMEFKSQNYLLSCDRNLWHQLRIHKLSNKYGKLMTDFILGNDERYHYYTIVNYVLNAKITDDGLKYLTNATTINLSYCNKITDEGLKYLVNATTIDLSYCKKITDNGLKYLVNATTIKLYGCDYITNEGIRKLKKRCPDIVITGNSI